MESFTLIDESSKIVSLADQLEQLRTRREDRLYVEIECDVGSYRKGEADE